VRPQELNEDNPSSNDVAPRTQANDQDQDTTNDQGGVVQDEEEDDQVESRSSPAPHLRVRQTVPRDHPIDNILGDIKKGVITRSCVTIFCEHYLFVSFLELFTLEDAQQDPEWVIAM
jgi:hypothetical protein